MSVVQSLNDIKAELAALRQDRTKFLQSADIVPVKDRLRQQLAVVLADPALEQDSAVQAAMEDVFKLFSMVLLTVGLSRRVPASYASLCTVQTLLSHLSESSAFTEADLIPVRDRVDDISRQIEEEADAEDCKDEFQFPECSELVRRKIRQLRETYAKVEGSMARVSPELEPLLRQLVSIRREIMSIGSRSTFRPDGFDHLLKQIRDIEALRDPVTQNFLSDGTTIVNMSEHEGDTTALTVPEGQSTVNGMLEKAHTLIEDFSTSKGQDLVDPRLDPVYRQLLGIKTTLENLLVTHRWTLRATDLYVYQKQLQEIDSLRVNGVIRLPDQADDEVLRGQSVLLYLIRRSYAMLYRLLESAEPISEALTHIHNQLTTVRRCLLEVQRLGGLGSARELYPYQMKLASIDALRVDGKFMVENSIPEGQGMVNALLAECFDLVYELRVGIEG